MYEGSRGRETTRFRSGRDDMAGCVAGCEGSIAGCEQVLTQPKVEPDEKVHGACIASDQGSDDGLSTNVGEDLLIDALHQAALLGDRLLINLIVLAITCPHNTSGFARQHEDEKEQDVDNVLRDLGRRAEELPDQARDVELLQALGQAITERLEELRGVAFCGTAFAPLCRTPRLVQVVDHLIDPRPVGVCVLAEERDAACDERTEKQEHPKSQEEGQDDGDGPWQSERAS